MSRQRFEVNREYDFTFSAELIRSFLRKIPSRSEEARRKLTYLTEFAVSKYLAKSTVQLDQMISGWVNNRQECRRTGSVKDLNALLAERREGLQQSARNLGFAGLSDLYAWMKGIDFSDLVNLASDILSATDARYAAGLEYHAASLKEKADNKSNLVKASLEGGWFDEFFSDDPTKLMAFAEQFLHITGTRPAGISVNCARAVGGERSYTLQTEQGILIQLYLSTGFENYRIALHELGHAVFCANIDPGLDKIYRNLGGVILSETYANLFENLLLNSAWVAGQFELPRVSEFVSFFKFYRLHILRRFCVQIIFEEGFYSGRSFLELANLYRDLWQRHFGFVPQAEMCFYLIDDNGYAVDYFISMILEMNLRDKLENNFGPTWFSREECYRLLQRYWRAGQKYTWQEYLRAIHGELSLPVILNSFK